MIKNSSFFLLAFLLIGLPNLMYGQKKSGISSTYLVKKYGFYENTDPTLNHDNFFRLKAEDMHLSPDSKMVLESTTESKNGWKHYRYQQQHLGLTVVGSHYTLHEANGRLVRGTGRYTPQLEAEGQTSITVDGAVVLAKKAMKAETYTETAPNVALCYVDADYPKVSSNVRLAYQVDLSSTEPLAKERYYVDAKNGKILSHFPLILEEGVPSKAKTMYYGWRNIVTDSLGPQSFVLRDPTRGNGIEVGDATGVPYTNTSSVWDLTNAQKDEVALDAHYCTQEYYDLLLSEYNWSGLDGNGGAMKVRVHNNGAGSVNAFWDGEYSNYGDGNCAYGPLTTLEVVGHEFTHGIIDKTSKLVYSSESGAINESLADMMGKRLEYAADPDHFDWDLGHSFLLTPEAAPFRVMDDPKSLEMPAMYKGEFWQDDAGVHTNSSIGNLWFTMLVDGKQGQNEAAVPFNVTGLGMEKAGQIVFETNKNYLSETSTYNDFYLYSTAVAESLYGVGSTEALAVKEAWKAVGLPTMLVSGMDLGIVGSAFSFESTCINDQFLPLVVKIENAGNEPYVPGSGSSMATIVLTSLGVNDRTVSVSAPLAPGEAVEYLVDDWIYIDDQNLYFNYQVYLNFNDVNFDNQNSEVYYEVIQSDSNDIGLYFLDIGSAKCFDNERSMLFFMANNSCTTIPAGTVLTYKVEDNNGTEIVFVNDTLTTSVLPGAYFTKEVKANLATTFINYSIDMPGEVNPDNNFGSTTVGLLVPLTGNYFNNFETDPYLDPSLEITGLSSNLLLNYQGTQHFAVTGYNTEDYAVKCPDPQSVFIADDGSVSSVIKVCVDYSAYASPSTSFDLRLFKSDYAQQQNYDYSSMLQLKWSGTENGEQYIFDQPQGTKVSHQIPLPANFKGEFKLRFYTEIGQWDPQTSNLSTDDFALLDNLRFNTQVSGTQEDVKSAYGLQVQPNPAADRVVVQTNQIIEQVWLRQLNGQQVRHFTANTTQQRIDLQGLPNGFYLLDIQLGNGQRVVEKLVKM